VKLFGLLVNTKTELTKQKSVLLGCYYRTEIAALTGTEFLSLRQVETDALNQGIEGLHISCANL
jgi:hypothetical protein